MRKALGITAVVLLAIAVFSALLGMAGTAGAVSGAGKIASEVDLAFLAGKVCLALSVIAGVSAFCIKS
jgi:hypothetical protein